MNKRSSLINWLIILLAVMPLIYLAAIFKSLPGVVPVHFDINFKPDRYDDKNNLWMITGMLAAVSIFVYFLLLNLRRFDPKQRNAPPSATFKRLAVVIAIFISVFNFLILLSINNHIEILKRLMLPLVGLLFAFLGNYMNNIKPNYFAGLRLPWTLSSDYNWRKTHQLASKIWFWGGLSAAILSLVIPAPYSFYIFFSFLFIMIIIPVFYSYKIFKQEATNNK